MVIPDYKDLLDSELNRFAFTTGIAKIADKLNDETLKEIGMLKDASNKSSSKTLELPDELREVADEKPVSRAFEKVLEGRDIIKMPEE